MQVSCRFCGHNSPLYFHTKDFNRSITKETFDYYRCPSCDLIFLSPVPPDLGKYYPSNYYFIPESCDHLEAAVNSERYKIDLVKQFSQKGRLLEIGPATGGFAYAAKQAGFEVEAVEMDERCCRFLNDIVGVPTINTSDTKAALMSAEPYDVIGLWHVIEHLPDPWETLEAVAARLNPGGILAIAMPNPAAFQFQILGRHWTHIDAPRHLVLIPAKIFVKRLQQFGLNPKLVTSTDEGSIGWNKFGWEESLANVTKHWRLKKLLRKVGAQLTTLLRPIEHGDLRGSTYTAIFQKVN